MDEAYVTDDFKDVYKYEDDKSIEQLRTYLDTYEKNVYIDEDANICKSSKGIDMDMIIFRLNVTNTGEKAEPFFNVILFMMIILDHFWLNQMAGLSISLIKLQ